MMEGQDIEEQAERLREEQEWQQRVEIILQSITSGDAMVEIFGGHLAARLFPDKVMDDLVLIGNALVGNTTLKQLFLDTLHLVERATVALANGIRQSKIKELILDHLSFVEDTSGGRQRSANILCDGIQSSKTLEELSVADMGEFTSMFSEAIIKTTNSLKTFLLLRREQQDHRVANSDLMRSLNNNNSLTNIEFCEIHMDDQHVRLLVESIHPNLPLKRLSLSGNKIGPMGVQDLLRAMARHPTWNELNLDNNKTIGYEGLRVLGRELQNMPQHGQDGINVTIPKFIFVHVNRCVVWNDYKGEDEKTKAVAMQQNMACKSAEQALLDGMKDNVFIVNLHVASKNQLSADTLTKINFYLQLNQMGRYLLGTNHGLATTIWCHVLAKCIRKECIWYEGGKQLATSITFFLLREQPHLVVPK